MDSFFAAGLDTKIATIDLHSSDNVAEALEQLERELFFYRDKNYCRVVYGVGEGILRKAVLEALEKNPMVGETKEEGGACLVLF